MASLSHPLNSMCARFALAAGHLVRLLAAPAATLLLPLLVRHRRAASTFASVLVMVIGALCSHIHAQPAQQLGARGQVARLIVNHNANNDEILVTATGTGHVCSSMPLRSNGPYLTPTSYKNLYAYLLAAKLAGRTLEFYTDPSCNLFRLEMVD